MSNIQFSSPSSSFSSELSDDKLQDEEQQHGLDQKVPITFLFTQLNGVVAGINKLQKKLTPETLNVLLDKNQFLPDGLTKIFNQRQQCKQTVVQILRQIFVTKFVLIGCLKVVSVILLFAIPVVMNILTNQVRQFAEQEQYNQTLIPELSVGLLFITFFQAIIDTQYSYQIVQLETQSKFYLYETLYFSAMTRKGVVSQKTQSSDLLTLINIDIGTIVNFFISFHECWSLLLKLLIGLTLLYLQMRNSIFIGFATAFILMIINFWVARKIGDYYQKGLIFKDRRMELLREFITYPKQIKFLKWEKSWFQKIMQQRIKEFKVISGSKWLDSMCVFFWSITNSLISTATISYFVVTQGSDQELKSQDIFTMIYLFNLITNPLNSLPWTISGMLQAKISFRRVDQYLLEPEEFNDFESQLTRDSQIKKIIDNDPFNLFQFYQAKYVWMPKQHNIKQQEKEEETVKIFPEEIKTDEFVLQIDNLTIQSQKLYIVIGPTASGKSAFINTLLKETYLFEGYETFKYEGDIALVPQSHWVSQTSIRGNITFEDKNIYQEIYYETLQRTQLLQDILKYDVFDQFNAGPEGGKLSGGQKQRLTLCRALYNEQDLYILDDPFSSLDPNVADKIFQNAILDYLVKNKNKSVIIVLNDSFLNKYVKYADQIILIKNGIVTTDPQKIQEYIQKNTQINIKQEVDFIEDILQVEEQDKNLKIQEFKESLQKQAEKYYIEQDDSNMNTKASLKLYFKQLGTYNLIWIIISVILMQFSFNFYDAWLNSYLNDNPIFLIKNSFTFTIIAITIFDLLVKIMRAVSFCYGNLKQAFSIFMIQAKKVIFGKASFFDKEESGQILSRLVGDQNVVDFQFPFELNILCNNIVNFFGTFILLIVLQWELIVPTFFAIFMFYKIQQSYRPTSLPLRRLEAQTSAQLTTQINDQYKGVKVIVAFNKSRSYFKILIKLLKNHLRVSWTSKCAGLWLQIRLQMVATFIVLCLLILTNISIFFQQLQVTIPPSTLQLLLYYTLTKISLFRDLTLSMTTCERELISYERIRHYMEYREENLDQLFQNPTHLDSKQPILTFDNLSLDYAFQPELFVQQKEYDKSTLSLKNINFTIFPGSMVAFCGRTGSGKSSILSMIFQLYQKCDGQILLKDKNLNSLIDWRSSISVIPQNGLVFKGTIEENLNNKNINEIQKQKLQQYIKSCPIKIDLRAQIDTDGKNISQGVKQVISFLRIILEDQDIICLDEATASVDQKVEEWILKILIDLCRNHGKTVIYISHRLETLDKFDYIYYLENGQILEQGTFQELVKDKNSKFNKLRSQDND